MSSTLDDDLTPDGGESIPSIRHMTQGLAVDVPRSGAERSVDAIDERLAMALETSDTAWLEAMADREWRARESANETGAAVGETGAFIFDVAANQIYLADPIAARVGAPQGAISRLAFLALLEPESRIRAAEALEEASTDLRLPELVLRLHEAGSGSPCLTMTGSLLQSVGGAPQIIGTIGYNQRSHTAGAAASAETSSVWSHHQIDRLAGVGCWRWEPKVKVLDWSDVLCEIAGVEQGTQPSPSMHLSLIHEEDRSDVLDETRRVFEGGAPEPIDYRIIRPIDGEIRRVQVTSRVFRDEDGSVTTWLGTARDVTTERDIEQRLHHSQKMEAIGRLAGGVAHDFNNYLAVMSGNAELLTREMSDRDPRRRYVEEITRAGNRARVLVRQLLAFSRRQTTEPRVIDVNEVLSNVHRMLELMLGEQVGLETVLHDDLHPVLMDPSQFEQVIVNLVVNARDAIQDQGMVLIETVNEFLAEAEETDLCEIPCGHYIKVTVADNGAGIPKDVMENIFEPFFTTKREGYGTGLGLSTAYGIIQRYDGYVRVNSEIGAGTRFEVLFPRASDVDEHALVRRTFGNSDRLPVPRGGTVLFTEDESQVRALTRLQLERGGYRVLSAASADEAMEIARNHKGEIDALVTDIVMPGINGIELASRLCHDYPSLRVLFVSGYAEVEIPKSGLMSGARLLPKPFTMRELLTTLNEIMDDLDETQARAPNG